MTNQNQKEVIVKGTNILVKPGIIQLDERFCKFLDVESMFVSTYKIHVKVDGSWYWS